MFSSITGRRPTRWERIGPNRRPQIVRRSVAALESAVILQAGQSPDAPYARPLKILREPAPSVRPALPPNAG